MYQRKPQNKRQPTEWEKKKSSNQTSGKSFLGHMSGKKPIC